MAAHYAEVDSVRVYRWWVDFGWVCNVVVWVGFIKMDPCV